MTKQGFNPKTGETTATQRISLTVDMELPMRGEYSLFIAQRLEQTQNKQD